jgi:hypothetical protein
VVRPREVDHLKRERLGAVVARVSEGDRQSDPPKGMTACMGPFRRMDMGCFGAGLE